MHVLPGLNIRNNLPDVLAVFDHGVSRLDPRGVLVSP